MKKLKEEKGSITLFVLIAMLFFLMYLVGLYVLNTNAEATQIAASRRIKQIYEQDINQKEDIYYTKEKEENIYYVKDKMGNQIPVPNGFSPITTSDQGTKQTGFVIKNDNDQNEFVWIPCSINGVKEPSVFNRYVFSKVNWTYNQIEGETDTQTNSTKIIRQDFPSYYYVESMIEKERESIQKYNGFYIGRYEVGTPIKRTSDTAVTKDLVVQKTSLETPIYPYNYIDYEQAKTLAEQLYQKQKDNVVSSLCSSYAWDTALTFIETKTASYSTNSNGNYSNTVANLQQTGVSNSVNNIYDMGGNVWEWTTETWQQTQYYRQVLRGGSFQETSELTPAGVRGNTGENMKIREHFGFRIALYL